MKLTKNGKRFIAIGAVVLILIAAIIIFVRKTPQEIKDPEGSEPAVTTTSSATEETSATITRPLLDVAGEWYSDREDGAVINLSEDGTYTCSGWLKNGVYDFIDGVITLAGIEDGKHELHISTLADKKTKILFYDNGVTVNTFYPTKELLQKAINESRQGLEPGETTVTDELREFKDILQGTWKSLDGSTTLTFNEDTYSISFIGNELVPAETIKYQYVVIDKAHLFTTNEKGKTAGIDIKITGTAPAYTVYSSCFEYFRTYVKLYDTVQTTATVTTTQRTETSIISTAPYTESPEFLSSVYAEIDRLIISTWKGTNEDHPNPNKNLTYKITFKADGTYTLSKYYPDGSGGEGIPYTENGTYKIDHFPTVGIYNSSVTMTHGNKTNTYKFYVTGKDIVSISFDSEEYPTMRRE